MLIVAIHFYDRQAQREFAREWAARTGGPSVDRIENGMQFMNANAERALDIANEVAGVEVDVIDGDGSVGWSEDASFPPG
jgi:hypothetical protein